MNSYDEFFRRNQRRILHLCYLWTLSTAQAANLAQDAFLAAFEHWDDIGLLSVERADRWITTVAVRRRIDSWRRQRSRFRAESRWSRERGPEDRDRTERPGVDLERALKDLTPRLRQAVALHHWADLTGCDCAEIMGVSEASFWTYLRRAHRRLGLEPPEEGRDNERTG